jgi:uncharacterized membrane protein YczE
MSNSIFIARLIGPVMLAVGIAVLADTRGFRSLADEFLASRALMFLSGLLIMPAGLAIVLSHNLWTADWRVLVTLFGWLNVIGGALRLFAPSYLIQTAHAMLRRPQFPTIAAAIWVALGLVFCLFGYLR